MIAPQSQLVQNLIIPIYIRIYSMTTFLTLCVCVINVHLLIIFLISKDFLGTLPVFRIPKEIAHFAITCYVIIQETTKIKFPIFMNSSESNLSRTFQTFISQHIN